MKAGILGKDILLFIVHFEKVHVTNLTQGELG